MQTKRAGPAQCGEDYSKPQNIVRYAVSANIYGQNGALFHKESRATTATGAKPKMAPGSKTKTPVLHSGHDMTLGRSACCYGRFSGPSPVRREGDPLPARRTYAAGLFRAAHAQATPIDTASDR